jgi:hypothetical protein
MENFVTELLPKVKANLILSHDTDDELIRGYIRAALDFAYTYQKLTEVWKELPPVTGQAVIMLSSHWYESRDGSTGGFFANNTQGATNAMSAVMRLLEINKERHNDI